MAPDELADELYNLRRLIESLVRYGTVASVDAGAGTVTVQYPGYAEPSAAMPWALCSAAFYAEPVVDDQAIVVCPSGEPGNAIALVGVSSVDADRGSKSEAARADLVETELEAVKTAYNGHTHTGTGYQATPLVINAPLPADQYDPEATADVKATYVKVD